MKAFKKNIASFVRKLYGKRNRLEPLSPGWQGAASALSTVAFLLMLIQGKYLLEQRSFFDFVMAIVLFMLSVTFISGFLTMLWHGLKKIPSRYIWVLLTSLVFLLFCFIAPLDVAIPFILLIAVVVSSWGALLSKWVKGSYKNAAKSRKISVLIILLMMTIGIGAGSYWLIHPGEANTPNVVLKHLKTSPRYDNAVLTNPGEPGSYPVKKLTYGSPDTYRQEFNTQNSLTTKTVDASHFVEKWSTVRTKTLGFGPDAMPLNGQVWYPEGKGDFPLVLIVHGNHLMTDYSDSGYDYLGNLLASRGYIVVSVDENFLNVSPYNDLFLVSSLENENPARGLLLLEHLQTWKEWNGHTNNPFYQKVDMRQIALIGHSRGGEAIAIAAAYNEMAHPPDNGNIQFDYNFSIRSLISIAGTDGQYLPSGKPLPLKNINYLALHGAHDMDVSTFDSANQQSRLSYTDKEDYMNASVYIYGANHGQFNESWGRGDGAGTANQLFNLKQIMPRDQQETIAKVLISAFLDSTLKDKKPYKVIFKDLGYAKEWLPDTMYINNYNDSQTTFIATFNEDIDVNTTTVPGGKLVGKNLEEWKEEKVKLKYDEADFNAVRLGWHAKDPSSPAFYTLTLPDKGLELGQNTAIVFSLADDRKEEKELSQEELIDFTVSVEDRNGNQASLPLRYIAKLTPAIRGKVLKKPFSNAGNTTEPVFQHYGFSLNDFKDVNPQFDPLKLDKIHFQFNLTKQGMILMNNIGIRNENS
ncbi:poly(ethylene terephthalate) hydrolase family protein [Lysinibacillus parviboronicapiens]|uniref:poly(ethylene terephthalate) hydrolase family protein n=1 Tax=Lysinibacillus parviboronicapiens TaxID=436516 RepID=UPI000D39545A|nr:alpha/beta hydrolase [Lysinibacillus parviboronicapiens]